MFDEKSILDTIENGIFIVNPELEILFWNRWLVLQTGISKEEATGRLLSDLFPTSNFNLVKRKVKIALKLGTSTFTSSSVEKYILPIKLQQITKSIFSHMRQDTVITPLPDQQASVVIYDSTALLEAKAVIDEQLHLMEKQATTDTLTGCYNRKMFNDLLSGEVKKAARYDKTFSLVIFDIDNFKSVNDTYGHLAGDEVLKDIAHLTRQTIRESDYFARWGGEEFAILLPETTLQGAATLADKVREVIKDHRFEEAGNLTCSFGVSQFNTDEPKDTLISNADWALYHAKNHGKNQVAFFANSEIKTWHPLDTPS